MCAYSIATALDRAEKARCKRFTSRARADCDGLNLISGSRWIPHLRPAERFFLLPVPPSSFPLLAARGSEYHPTARAAFWSSVKSSVGVASSCSWGQVLEPPESAVGQARTSGLPDRPARSPPLLNAGLIWRLAPTRPGEVSSRFHAPDSSRLFLRERGGDFQADLEPGRRKVRCGIKPLEASLFILLLP